MTPRHSVVNNSLYRNELARDAILLHGVGDTRRGMLLGSHGAFDGDHIAHGVLDLVNNSLPRPS